MGSITDELLSGHATPQVAPPPVARSATDELLSPASPPEVPRGGTEPPRYQPDKAMGMGLQGVGSLATDPKARIRWYSEQTSIPAERFSVGQDGRIVYQGDDGKSYYAEAPSRFPRSFQEAGQQVMKGIGPSFPAVPSAVAGILSIPTGPAVSMGVTGLAGAGGEAVRQGIANQVMGQDFSPKQMAIEGGQAALGQGIGFGLTALANRGAAKDIARLDPKSVADLRAKAQAEGVQLTPAESTGLPSLAARQKALGNLPASADDMTAFYQRRSGQVADAVNRNLNAISPVDSPEMAGKMAINASKQAIDDLAAARSGTAGPLYREATKSGQVIDVDPVLAAIDKRLEVAKGPVASALRDARALLTVETTDASGKVIKVPDTRIEALHEAKIALDDMIERAASRDSSIGRAGVNALKDVKTGLLDALSANPNYAEGRKVFAAASPANTWLQESTLPGVLADMPDLKARQAVQTLFSPTSSGPQAAETARKVIESTNPEAWQAVKRAYLESIWAKAQKPTLQGEALNAGAKFYKEAFGDLKQEAILKKVLSADEYRAWRNLGEVLQAAGRVKPIGSDTAWNQEVMKQMRAEGVPADAKIVKFLTSPHDWGKMYQDWRTEMTLRSSAGKMAEMVTSPDAMTKLRELRQLSPSSVRFRVALGHFLVRFGGLGAELVGNELSPDPTGQPQ